MTGYSPKTYAIYIKEAPADADASFWLCNVFRADLRRR